MYKLKFLSLTFLAVFQMITAKGFAETHVEYVYAMTGNGIAKGLNEKLMEAQAKAYGLNQFFEFIEISITPEWGYAYLLYNISDTRCESNPFVTKVAYVSSLTAKNLGLKLQDEINFLEEAAVDAGKTLHFIDMKLTPEWGYGYLIYEISEFFH